MIFQSNRTRNWPNVNPLASLDGNMAIYVDGRVAIAFEIFCAEMQLPTELDHKAYADCMATICSDVPPGTVIQKIEVFEESLFRDSAQDQGYFERKEIDHRYNRYVMFHRSILLLSFGHPKEGRVNAASGFFSLGKILMKNPLEGIQHRQSLAKQKGKEIIERIKAQKYLDAKPLTGKELKAFCKQYVNLQFDSNEAPNGYKAINKQPNGLIVGNQKVNLISLVGQGMGLDYISKDRTGISAAFASPISHQLLFPHLVSTSIYVANQGKVLQGLDTRKRIQGSLDFLTTQDVRIQTEEIDQITHQVRKEHKPLVYLSQTVHIWHPNPEVLQYRVDQVCSAYRSMGSSEYLVEGKDSAALFIANFPGFSGQNYRRLLMPAENAAAYMPFTTLYRCQEEGVRLGDRYLHPLWVKLFNTALNNQNSIVIGPSGSGKSFTVGSWIIQRFEQGHRQIIIDIGGTYRNAVLTKKVEGSKYFEIDTENPLSFNPFLVEKDSSGRYRLTPEKETFLAALLASIWMGSSEKELDQVQLTILVKFLNTYYLNLREDEIPRLDHFYTWLKAYDAANSSDPEYLKIRANFNVDALILVLEPFVFGEYKQVLNSESIIDISSYPLIAFDLAGIKSNRLLYPVISLLITELALDQIRKFPNEKKFLYLDEAWAMLNAQMGKWVEEVYRTIRKANGSISIITQGISEIENSPVGKVLLANAATKVILNHKGQPDQVEGLVRLFGFTDHEKELIESLRVAEGWREIFIKQGDFSRVYTLEVSDHMAAALTSKPEERNRLNQLIQERGHITFALDQYVENRKEVENG